MQLDQYQENPTLLDPHLAGLVTPLAAALRVRFPQRTLDGTPETTLNVEALGAICRFLWALATVRRVVMLSYCWKAISTHLEHMCRSTRLVLESLAIVLLADTSVIGAFGGFEGLVTHPEKLFFTALHPESINL